MGNAIEKAERAARKAIESTYKGMVTVTEYKKVKDPNTALTSYKEVVVLENQPCSLSFESIAAAVQTGTVATVSQAVKLFLSPDITIKPGSKLTVTQTGGNNRIFFKRCSGSVPNASGNHIGTV